MSSPKISPFICCALRVLWKGIAALQARRVVGGVAVTCTFPLESLEMVDE